MKGKRKKLYNGLLIAMIVLNIQSLHAEPIRIMSLGDSITAGYPTNNYRLQLAEKLRSISCDVDFVGSFDDTLPTTVSSHSAVWGIPATTVDTIGNQAPNHPYSIDTMMNKSHPDVVLMLLGGNDIRLAISPENIINSLRSIITKIRSYNPSAKIFVGMYPNILKEFPDMAVMNGLIPTLIEDSTEQSPIILVDHSGDYNTADGADTTDAPLPNTSEGNEQTSNSSNYDISVGADTTDTVHANINGDSKYANNWFKELVNSGICTSSKIVYNVALNKPVSVSDNIYGHGTPYFAVNNLVNDTGWFRIAADEEQSLTIDLQGNYNISDLELSHVSTDAYQIEVSEDKATWNKVVEENDNNKRKMTHQIPPVDARYVRLTLKPPFVGNLMTVKEFRVMGVPNSIP